MIPSKFHRALLRLPEAQRPQHCYTTAAAMPLRKFPLAKELIEYSLELEGSWLDRMRAHSNLADLYERKGDYTAALQSYRLALEAVPAELQEKYRADTASRMLVCRLHVDDFAYSADLRRLYEQASAMDEFSRSFQKCLFYMSLARFLLGLHDGDLPSARSACDQAVAMLRPGHRGPLTALLRRKGYRESTGATTQARAFLNKIQHQLP
jgi:tetratricopeptide (TPR) repeat protein